MQVASAVEYVLATCQLIFENREYANTAAAAAGLVHLDLVPSETQGPRRAPASV